MPWRVEKRIFWSGDNVGNARTPERTCVHIDIRPAGFRHHEAEALLFVEELDVAVAHRARGLARAAKSAAESTPVAAETAAVAEAAPVAAEAATAASAAEPARRLGSAVEVSTLCTVVTCIPR